MRPQRGFTPLENSYRKGIHAYARRGVTCSGSLTGFTLIETVVYLGLFAVLMTGLISSAFYLLASSEATRERIAIQEEGTFILRKLSYAVSGADAAEVAGTSLSLSRPDLPVYENPLVVTETDGVLFFSRGEGEPDALTSSLYPVEDLSFNVSQKPGESVRVVAEFSLRGVPFRFDAYLRE